MKETLLKKKGPSSILTPVFKLQVDKHGSWFWLVQDSERPLKEPVLLGEFTETKRGYTVTNYTWSNKPFSIFYDRSAFFEFVDHDK